MSETEGLLAVYRGILRGWNARDADAMAECFSSSGIMIGFDGSLAQGTAEIREHLSPIFRDHPTAAFVSIIRVARATGSGGLVLADVGMVPPGAGEVVPATLARQTLVVENHEGGPRAELFQNTPTALHWDEDERERFVAQLQDAYTDRGPLPAD